MILFLQILLGCVLTIDAVLALFGMFVLPRWAKTVDVYRQKVPAYPGIGEGT